MNVPERADVAAPEPYSLPPRKFSSGSPVNENDAPTGPIFGNKSAAYATTYYDA
jgi:hypothetical protein